MELDKLLNLIDEEANRQKEQARKDFEAGMNDCKAGVYDKWYRYHHQYDGAAYDAGWVEQNKTTQNEKVRFMEND